MTTLKKTYLKIFAISCLISAMISCDPQEKRTDLIALKGYNIITLEDENVTVGKILVIKNDTILDLLTEERFYSKYSLPDSLIIEGNGKFLMPSFTDMHVHLQPNNPNHKTYLSHFLGFGITNVRVMAGNENLLAWKDSIQQGLLLGPELRVAGPLIDGSKPLWGEGHTGPVVMNIEKVDSIVLSHKEKKYDLIKLYERLPREVYLEFVRAASAHNIKVAGHIPYSVLMGENLSEVFNQNSPGFEHFSNFGSLVTSKPVLSIPQPGDMNYYGNEIAGDPDLDRIEEVTAIIKDQNIWVCPTSVLRRNIADSLRTNSVISSEAFKRIDSGLKNWWLSTMGRSKNQNQAHLTELFLREMASQKVKLLAGTDFPNPFLIPGYSLHQEIHSFVEMGYSNLEALKSATVYPAEYWGELESRGRIRIGSAANLLVLEKNPLEDIENTLTVEQVIFKGDIFQSRDLLKIQEEIK